MLVLTRRAGESVVIGDDVVVTVVEVRGDVVRLGIDAPREVKVHREEVYRAVAETNAAAAAVSDDDVSRLTQSLRRSAPPG
ncbi:carbon storage regulator CsrA [Thalassiella azotivora]